MPRRGSSKPPAEPVVKPYGCDLTQFQNYDHHFTTFQEMENKITYKALSDV